MGKLTINIILIIFLVACNQKKQNPSNHPAQEYEGREMENMPGMGHQEKNADTLLQNVLSPANKTVLSNAETIHPELREITNTVHASGYIAFDERRNNKVSVRTSGRIEKLYVKLNYQYVHKGDKLMELYSPELNAITEEYLHHLKTESDSNLVDATKQKMKLLGITEKQFKEIEAIKNPLSTITIYSSYDGFILYDFEQQQIITPQINSSSPGMGGMDGGINANRTAPSAMQSTGRIREGNYVNKGQTLFVVNDCKEVFAIISFDAQDEIRLDAAVKIKSPLYGEKFLVAKINFIEPVFREGQKFIQARAYLRNELKKLKINSIVSAELESTGKYLVVPSSSILSLGNRKYIWLKKENAFEKNKWLQATEVKVGKEVNGYTQIISGITTQDEVAKDAGYLLDSESLIKPESK